ncbi:MAG: glycosyltransferase family 4 protein [Thiotrichales bacterium]|nr:glycosyltransferase family 4 protein [Thiotrichales bacterium]
MRIAFYAPLKAPDHPTASGDRLIAGLLVRALERAGHKVVLASRLRTFDGTGDRGHQFRLAREARAQAGELLGRWLGSARAPRCWFTYHLYHKAPDWIGPRVSHRLGIPYLVAEASHAPKQARGPWRHGHRAVEAALARADRVIALNPDDVPGLAQQLGEQAPIVRLAPFVDVCALAPPGARARRRARIARLVGVDSATPLLVCVAMMRHGRKAESFRRLAGALERIAPVPWHLLVVGDGPARVAVEAMFATLRAAGRVTFLGLRSPPLLHGVVSAGDLFVWPALGEPIGMAMLEAQALGVPVIAGDARGVGAVVAHGEGGWLVPEGDEMAFADAVARALADPPALAATGAAARARVLAEHGIDTAARRLDRWIADAVGAFGDD